LLNQSVNTNAKTQKRYFDARVKRYTGLRRWSKGLAVLTLPLLKQQSHKLSKLLTGLWQVTDIKSDLIVIITHQATGKCQVVHVDRLLPCCKTANITPVHAVQSPVTSSANRCLTVSIQLNSKLQHH